MIRPTPEQLSLLRGFERTAFRINDTVNRVPALKSVAQTFLRTFGAGWVHVCTRNLRHVHGLEHICTLNPDRGVLVVCNHRSFFDLYVVSCIMLRECPWIREMYFPVRSQYWYERPDGVVVSAIMSALAMYPPVFRDQTRRPLNQYVVDFIADAVKRPGTLVGFHPEGTRNKTADPYAVLPANPGIGQIVYAARPIVIPAFILGLGNDLPRQVVGNFTRTGDPVHVVFGPPMDLSAFYAESPRLRTYKKLADHLRDRIATLGHEERRLRIATGGRDYAVTTSPAPTPSRGDE